jgi:hypothetical protein
MRTHAKIQRILKLIPLIAFSWQSHALKTDFTRDHSGLSLGGGIYQHYLPNDNQFDPVADLAPSGVTVTGSTDVYILPLRMGYFVDKPTAGFSIYGRYIINLPFNWTTSGSSEGTGSTKFASYGVGADITPYLVRGKRFRLGVTLNAEYLWQKLTLSYSPTSGLGESLVVSSNSILTGLGVRPEVYLGDQWALSVFAGYQYGFNRFYSAAVAGTLFGVSHSAGALTGPVTGVAIPSQHGGFLLEAVLKLNFM